jgi:23S rRNA (adenine2503-C2)-methyltransferase
MGLPIACIKFCATGNMKRSKVLSSDEIIDQVMFVLDRNSNDPNFSREFKINYTRMGEPFLNIDAVKTAINKITALCPNTHHYISTIGIKGSDFSWIEGNISLQISLHACNDEKRDFLIPHKSKMSIAELGKIRTKSKLKTTLNLTLVEESDFDIDVLKEYFDPEYFFIKLSPINPNEFSDKNLIGAGAIKAANMI